MCWQRRMIQLRVLGPTELVGDGGESLLSVLSQPKRLTLLTYLALNATGGFTRRDKLLGLFWPESDSERARASLRRSLSFLRASLGEGVLQTRGDDEVGIANDALECDAVRFEAALGRGDREAALQLYRGALLDAVFVSDAPGLERWLEDERSRLRRLAADAAAEMADACERQGDVPAALAWARHALELEPHSEPGISRLIGLLGRAGDREGAIRTYDEFAERLKAEFDLEPSAQTQTVTQSVRDGAQPAAAQPGGTSDLAQGERASERPSAALEVRAARTPALPAATASPRPWSRRLYVATLSVAALVIALALWGWLRPAAPRSPVVRYSMVFAEGEEMAAGGRRFALSADGSLLVYAGQDPPVLRVRRRDRLHSRMLPGTEHARSPFFSPDGGRVGFFANGVLSVASLDGGPITDITTELDGPAGAAWGPDGFIYARRPGFDALVRLRPEPGAVPEPFTRLDSLTNESRHTLPDVLPNGRGVLFTVVHAAVTGIRLAIAVADLETGAHRVLVEGLFARYAASGHLLYVDLDSRLMVAPFDPVRLELTGPPAVVGLDLRMGQRGGVVTGPLRAPSMAGDLAVSATGTLVYATAPPEGARQLVWVSRDGTFEPLDTSWLGGFGHPTLSPDGSRLAVTMTSDSGSDVWIRQMDTGALFKLTVEGTTSGYASWTPDGRSVTYFSNRGGSGELWTRPADGSAHAVLQLSADVDLAESLWSPDGQWLIYRTTNVPRAVPGEHSPGAADILAVRPGRGEEPVPLVSTEYTEVGPALSPDGRWLAFSSQVTGREEVFVVPFPNTGDARWSISPEGGREPLWSHRGDELFYKDARGSMHVVQVTTSPTFSVGRNTVMFDGRRFVVSGLHAMYAVSPDDQRLLMVLRAPDPGPGELIVVENWFEELRRLAHAN